ncbi:MAG: beta-lactamase family protein [Bacteroidetes bacterium]|nr:beta-lactamase family protein [Rhodothermia bacterium]MCS7154196.1 beta-lactamase family protein [Bacteroidota bacterium]MCX7906768.1 beta-lactamase family protein [Bacteroidota bacterium]MDW8136952.1 serine hydrolase [Bacteroidota bacterium]MDW8285177.1 serine hydrolase [Bacteroidota bacterium]
MKRTCLVLGLLCSAGPFVWAQQPYFPDPWPAPWAKRPPELLGFDPRKLQEAIAFARAQESRAPRDLELAHYQSFGREPFGNPVGPFAPRGEQTGIIIRGGYVVAEWGEPDRVEMAFSVTKSFLSTVVGLALERGLIRDLRDPVWPYVGPIWLWEPHARWATEPLGRMRLLDLFGTPHNRKITWDHLLRQTSDWEGELWGKPDWADRPDPNPDNWIGRPRHEPGSVYEYNDVRVNVLALAALQVWRRPLPEVLRELIMDPIGASSTWRWYGYQNSWVVLDGRLVQSVSGGGHWGGGMFISAWDMARFGYLLLRNGRWRDRQLLSPRWIALARTPTPVQPTYGFMNWFLNTDRRLYPSAPETAFAHLGNGANVIYIDPEHDLVVVLRWIQSDQVDAFLKRLLEALRASAPETGRTR